MKKRRKSAYFDGEISDGKSKMRLFGFEPEVQNKLVEYRDSGAAVTLGLRAVRLTQEGTKFEVMVKSGMVLKDSEAKFEVEGGGEKVVTLADIEGMQDYDRVTVVVKVVVCG